MLTYLGKTMLEPKEVPVDSPHVLDDAVWIDLYIPSKIEEALVERYMGQGIPTREEMVQIELSSRLYKEHGSLFMTATIISESLSDEPMLDPVTFILTPRQLITIRYINPQAFRLFSSQLQKIDTTPHNAPSLLLQLLDAAVDRLADILELVGHRLDNYSKTIFTPQQNREVKLDYQKLMQQIGANGNLNTKARESLITFNRLITFFGQSLGPNTENELQLKLSTLSKDITSLSDHSTFLSSKINFLLDATLGLVNIEQNNIIKIFSVAAVIFLPPTLIASIYGMNFHAMPELSWRYGYIFAISCILFAAWLPYKYFKHKKWL